MPGGPKQPADTRTLAMIAFSATAGVFIEYYDFLIFGYAAASAFPSIFFPRLPPTQALLFSYLAFGAGFPARLLGAFLFGHFGDRIGRKFSFMVNIIIVGATTCATGLLPGYAKLGIAAPILLVALRIVQGIGIGGEFGGASSFAWRICCAAKPKGVLDVAGELGRPFGLYQCQRCPAGHEQDVRNLWLAGGNAALCRDSDSGTAGTLQACRQPASSSSSNKLTSSLRCPASVF